MAKPEPRSSWLRRLLRRPDARPRVARAVASLLGVGVVSIGTIGMLVIWHLVRRGRLIREGLPAPRKGARGAFEFADVEPDPREP